MNLKNYLVTRQKLIDRALDRYLPKANRKPTTLHRAMRSVVCRWQTFAAILCLATAEACRGKIDDAFTRVRAECIHTYSLVHDLPSMDNDDFRRGVPPVHKVSARHAVLAGDAL